LRQFSGMEMKEFLQGSFYSFKPLQGVRGHIAE
jgi:hypothetical protein